METLLQNNSQLQYEEVYISDIPSLRTIYTHLHNSKNLNQDFGLPFLLAKNKTGISGFASLILNEKEEITFKINDNGLSETEKRNLFQHAERYFKKNTTANFRHPEQLKSSISRMVSWLNVG